MIYRDRVYGSLVYKMPRFVLNRTGVSFQIWQKWKVDGEPREWPTFVLTLWFRLPPKIARYR